MLKGIHINILRSVHCSTIHPCKYSASYEKEERRDHFERIRLRNYLLYHFSCFSLSWNRWQVMVKGVHITTRSLARIFLETVRKISAFSRRQGWDKYVQRRRAITNSSTKTAYDISPATIPTSTTIVDCDRWDYGSDKWSSGMVQGDDAVQQAFFVFCVAGRCSRIYEEYQF